MRIIRITRTVRIARTALAAALVALTINCAPAAPTTAPATTHPQSKPERSAGLGSSTAPATPTTQPAISPQPTTNPSTQPSTQPAMDANAEALLDQIQAAQAATRTLLADLTYIREQGLLGDRQLRTGKLIYESGPPAKFALRFDKLIIDKRLERQEQTYLCDGRWLVEMRHNEKQFLKRQIVAPDAPAEKADPLRLGEGPFPIPLGLDKARVAARFNAQVIAPNRDDPAGQTVHLRLMPRADRPSNLSQIDFWFDRQTLAPIRGKVVDESENRTIIELKNSTTNAPLPPNAFDVSEPKEEGWRIEVTPWQGR